MKPDLAVPMPAKAPTVAEQQDYWNDRWERNRSPNVWQQRRSDVVLEFIRPLALTGPRILDLGCATGWFTDRLSLLGRVTGVDLSEKAVDTARKTYPHIEYLAGNFYEMSFPPEHFDLIVNQEVIAHVPDQKTFLEKIARILKPAGYLVITTANKLVMDRCDFGPDPDAHIKKWLSMKDLKRLLQPHFRVLRAGSALPLGDRGFLRLVNSYKLNAFLSRFVSQAALESIKERAGMGYTLIILAQKR